MAIGKTRILFIIDHLGPGGAQKMLFHLSEGLCRTDRYSVRVLSLQPAGIYSNMFSAAGIPVRHGDIFLLGSPLSRWAMLKTSVLYGPQIIKTLFMVIREVRAFRPQLINTFLFGSDLFGALVAKMHHVKVINSIRATNIWKLGWHRLFSRLYYPLVDRFTVNCSATVRFLSQEEGVPLDKIQVIFNGVDASKPVRSGDEARRALNIPSGRKWIVSAGRFDEQKGFSYLIESARLLRNAGYPVLFSIFGNGPQASELESLIRQYQLEGIVRLEPYRDDIRDVIKAADVFVLSSVYEGMPNVLLEAMVVKTPVVATRIDGAMDIIEDRQDGLLVEPRSAAQLFAAIAELIKEGQKAKQLAANGFEKVSRKFTLSNMVDSYDRLYQSLG